jgi:hypothetical protein
MNLAMAGYSDIRHVGDMRNSRSFALPQADTSSLHLHRWLRA